MTEIFFYNLLNSPISTQRKVCQRSKRKRMLCLSINISCLWLWTSDLKHLIFNYRYLNVCVVRFLLIKKWQPRKCGTSVHTHVSPLGIAGSKKSPLGKNVLSASSNVLKDEYMGRSSLTWHTRTSWITRLSCSTARRLSKFWKNVNRKCLANRFYISSASNKKMASKSFFFGG